ncbi:21734_t:CDS:2, partial [Gigaspora rosea]
GCHTKPPVLLPKAKSTIPLETATAEPEEDSSETYESNPSSKIT